MNLYCSSSARLAASQALRNLRTRGGRQGAGRAGSGAVGGGKSAMRKAKRGSQCRQPAALLPSCLPGLPSLFHPYFPTHL